MQVPADGCKDEFLPVRMTAQGPGPAVEAVTEKISVS